MYRYLIVFGLLAAVLAIGGTAWDAFNSAVDPNGRDSFGSRYFGWRGFYETLEKLALPVERSRVPPPLALRDRQRVLVFWESSLVEIGREPEYLTRVREWIESGGEAVIALPRYSVAERLFRGNVENFLLKILIDNAVSPMIIDTEWQGYAAQQQRAAPTRRTLSEDVGNYEQAISELRDPRVYQLRGTGDFADTAAKIETITLPRVLQNLRFARRPQSMLVVLLGHRRWALAAKYAVGNGAVTIVAEPSLIYNLYAANDGNAALAARILFTSPAKTAVFDEFYHGHHATRRAYQLFTQPPYREIAVAVGLLLGLLVWRGAIRFGPALPETPPARRTILEYVGALARWLQRGQTQTYLAKENCAGIFWDLRRFLYLSPRAENADLLIKALGERSPENAEKFARAARQCENYLARNENNERRLLRALSDLTIAAATVKNSIKNKNR